MYVYKQSNPMEQLTEHKKDFLKVIHLVRTPSKLLNVTKKEVSQQKQ